MDQSPYLVNLLSRCELQVTMYDTPCFNVLVIMLYWVSILKQVCGFHFLAHTMMRVDHNLSSTRLHGRKGEKSIFAIPGWLGTTLYHSRFWEG